MKTLHLLPTILLALAACTSVKTSLREPLPPLPLQGAKGIVVFSTGAPEGSYMNVIGLRLTAVDRQGKTSNSATDALMNRGYDASDFTDEFGQVRLAVLDEGAYCFYPVPLNPYLSFKEAPEFSFDVRKGAVTYIGSLFMNGLQFSVRNQEARDLAKALAAHPELAKLDRRASPARIVKECVSSKRGRAKSFDDF